MDIGSVLDDQTAALSRFPEGELTDAAEIGAITDTSVRVWVRQPKASSVDAELLVEGRPPVRVTIPLSVDTDWTGYGEMILPEPAPGRLFECRVGSRRLHGRLAPSDNDHVGFNFGFGSCNRPFKVSGDGRVVLNNASGLYSAARQDLLDEQAAFLLLLGDQVYSDALDPLSIRDNLPGDEHNPPPLSVAIEAYRRVARGFLGQTGFQALREAFPTYCIWDDHDIFNDWGSRLHESPLDKLLFRAATRVFCEYQHSRNPGGEIGTPPFNYNFRYGTVGFLILDLRGSRSYQDGTMLGLEQWAAIQEYLNSAGAEEIQTLFVSVSVPIAHVSRWVVKLLEWLPGHKGDDVRDRWCADAFVESRDAFLDRLFAWQSERSYRQVILLSGDVHAANAFTIRQVDGPGVIRQFTSSALTTESPAIERWLNPVLTAGANLFESRYRFQRHFVFADNNYGLVRVEPLAGGGHRIEYVVRAWNASSLSLVTKEHLLATPAGVTSNGRNHN